MDDQRPCIFFNTKNCSNLYCQFSHLPDDYSIQIAPGRPNICKKYLLDPRGCLRFPGTCWYSHDILGSGHTSWQKLYDLLSDIRKKEFEKTGRHDTGSFVARFMNMLIEEKYAKDGLVLVAADAEVRSVIGDEALARIGMVVGSAKRKRNTEDDGAEDSHRSKIVKIKEEPMDPDANALQDLPSNSQPRPSTSTNVKIKQEPGLETPAPRPVKRSKQSTKIKKEKEPQRLGLNSSTGATNGQPSTSARQSNKKKSGTGKGRGRGRDNKRQGTNGRGLQERGENSRAIPFKDMEVKLN